MTTTQLTTINLLQLRIDVLEDAMRAIAARQRHPSGDAATLLIALRALGDELTP